MRPRSALFLVFACLASWGILLAQKPFHDYVGETPTEYRVGEVPLPPDWNEPAEWTRGRLKYDRVGILHGVNWDTGWMGWATDYPLGDRNFASGIPFGKCLVSICRKLCSMDPRFDSFCSYVSKLLFDRASK